MQLGLLNAYDAGATVLCRNDDRQNLGDTDAHVLRLM